jgi:PD-(D/E)XK nuclease superfamily protein
MSAVLTPPDVTLGGETVVRDIPGIGVLKFEDYGPGEWMTKKGEPAKTSRRRYLLNDVELDAVSSITGTLDKPALLIWYEDQASRGAVAAERMGELIDVAEEDYVKRVRALGLGASAARDEGADRGKAIHTAMHALAVEGRPANPADHPAEWRPWFQGAVRAWLALDPEPTASEEIVCHPEHGYAGRPDLLAIVAGKLTMIDYKTGKGRVYDSAHYQTRLYAMALQRSLDIAAEQIIIVGIDDDGGFQLITCEATEADALSLLHTYRSRRRINADMATQRQIAKAAAA